ncbi:MAG TPA: glycoside hydrolase family 3 C-terminal domain-containing protein [Terracidiphilus sp.]|nr:glycoside hydrolase family 3 C-terminal domain-containing protein [Terracidiphilus sp.]
MHSSRWIRSLTFVVLIALVAGVARVVAQGPVPDSPAIEERVNQMVAKLTLEQKIRLIGGEDSLFIRAEPTVGFTRLKMSDGPAGVRGWGPVTGFTAGIGLAATWDPELAEQVGTALGHDARSRGIHFLLGPGVNIYRAPMAGRNFEYFGEDPFLASRITVGYIRGVQSQNVIATVKHFAANNEEYDRHNVSSDVDERTLREIYLPAFEAAVKEAGVGAVMDSYNLINGVHATENNHLNNEILKKDWGFNGILMSDWGSTYDGIADANGGLDLEMPDPNFMNAKTLIPAIKDGKVQESVIDDKVRRIFRTAIRFGFIGHDQYDLVFPAYSQENRAVALNEARESIVMLKNERATLPLDLKKMKTIAVLGPDAWPAVIGGGGSSQVTPYSASSLMSGLSDAYLGKVKVLYARGVPSMEDMLDKTEFHLPAKVAAAQLPGAQGHNLIVEQFDNADFTGSPVSTHFADHVDTILWPEGQQYPQAKGIRYTAEYRPAKDGVYLFLVTAGGGGAYNFYIDGKQQIKQIAREGIEPLWVELPLKAATPVTVQLDYIPSSWGGTPQAGLGVRALEDMVTPEARKIAAMADAVIVDVGFDGTTECEGFDRTYALPWGQDELIEAALAINPKTVVVLTGGGDVDTHLWIDKAPALLHQWYPGQEGATALADILSGAHSPEGRLPITFPHSWEENPTHDSYYAPDVAAGATPHVKYSEGVFLGYRSFVTTGKKPLYPFGYGLTYTTFAFSNLKVTPLVTGGHPSAEISFDVANTGKVASADVAQVYVGDPSAKVSRPRIELKGFRKVRLAPGEKKHVVISLDERSFAYWDEKANQWRWDDGQFTIAVGDSSESLPLSTTLELKK